MTLSPSTWPVLATALANHLWQSTLFLAAAALLTAFFRKNHARVRYWIWLAASVKFLLPFSWLIAFGSRLSWFRRVESAPPAFTTFDTLGTLFNPTASVVPHTAPHAGLNLIHLLPVLLTTWLCGSVLLIAFWVFRWKQVATIVRAAEPLRSGREAEALQTLTQALRVSVHVNLLSTSASLEPGIFGVFRPTLVWPSAISVHFSDSHLRSILAHELCHVRRRDNLTAMLHSLVESLFWFHPLVWWLGARLIEQRELACDEEVIAFGTDRRVYAESILKVCEFCTSPPLACVSGVTGADLKRRISRIMKENRMTNLNLAKTIWLSVAGVATVAIPVGFGILHAPPSGATQVSPVPANESLAYRDVSIQHAQPGATMMGNIGRPDGFRIENLTLEQIISNTYNVESFQISDGPAWLASDKFDIHGRIDELTQRQLASLSQEQRSLERVAMMKALLADRFALRVHQESRTMPTYSLVVAPGGPRLKKAVPGDTYPDGLRDFDGHPVGPHMMQIATGMFTVQALSMPMIARLLTQQMNRSVFDNTALQGEYDFVLKWSPDESQPAALRGTSSSPGPSIFNAIQDQLGLELQPTTGPVEVLVIDHVEAPKEN